MRNNDVALMRGRFTCSPGTNIHQLYSPKLMDDGTIQLIECGTEDTDEIIQSYYESTTLEVILKKFTNGDLSALNRYQPIYMDVTKGPHNLAQAMQLMIDAETAFDALPVDIKNKFDNNYRKWILTSQDKEWYEKMAPVMSTISQSETAAMNNNTSENSNAKEVDS